MNSKKHIIFDLDGTLIDSFEIVRELLNTMRTRRKLPPLSFNQLRPLLSIGGTHLISEALGLDKSEAAGKLKEFRQRYLEIPTPLDSIYPGAVETLRRLKVEGFLLSICTNKPRNLAEKILAETGIIEYIDSMCAGGDIESPKPDPRNIAACLVQGLKPTSLLLVGDSTIDQKLATNAGISFIFHTGGYNDGVDESQVSAKYSHYGDFPYDLILD
jgi:phosphoglycolate phosphatase